MKNKYTKPTILTLGVEMEEGIASSSCPGNSCNAPGQNKGNEDYEHPGNGNSGGDNWHWNK